MSLGGRDLVLDGVPSLEDVDTMLRGLRAHWPSAVAARADEEITEGMSLHGPGWPVLLRCMELFVAKDADLLRAWIDEGASPDKDDTMVHLLVSPDALTAVVDDDGSELARIVRQLFEQIRRRRAERIDAASSPWRLAS